MLPEKRREIARKILSVYQDIHYFFEVMPNGDLIFIEPYNIQKNTTTFNYAYRNSLKLAKKLKSTSISEVHISNDQNGTQSIAVATPVFNNNQVKAIIGVSVSVVTLKNQIFKVLKQNINLNRNASLYLLDHHGHVIVSSSGDNVYFPLKLKMDDENDSGNVRGLKIFNKIKWNADIFEDGSFWRRKTKSWDSTKLLKIYRDKYVNINGIEVIGTFLPITLDGSNANWGILIETPIDQVLTSGIFAKKVFYISGLALIIVLLFVFIRTLRNFTKLEYAIVQKDKERRDEIAFVASQVAHDIRSPLAALNVIIQQISILPEQQRILVRNATKQINDIANNLLSKYKKEALSDKKLLKKNDGLKTIENIYILLSDCISAKRIQYSNKSIDIQFEYASNIYNLFALVSVSDFNSVLSNLINNAIEAMNNAGIVKIYLSQASENIQIVIDDNGCGMSDRQLNKVLKGGVSVGKNNGYGLGLHSSKFKIESWGGRFVIESKKAIGTVVTLDLPAVEVPDWIQSELILYKGSTVIVLDDDQSIHDIWKIRIQNQLNTDNQINLIHFNQMHAFENYEHNNLGKSYYLIDYELLDSNITGLDIIKKLNIANKATLVTSRHDDGFIRDACKELGCKILPKIFAAYIPLNIVPIKPDLVLIDDDELLISSWQMSAKFRGEEIIAFRDTKDAMRMIVYLPKATPIFIDSHLSNNEKGEEFAKILFDIGFKNIYLATGYSPEFFGKLFWIKKIVGKNYPDIRISKDSDAVIN